MKRYIRSSQVPNSYLYIFKHGIGPGTIPRDIEVIRTKDLPNGYTAVWLNRFLTYDELKQYDIPSETRINELLGRIGYCQKNGDVVPCSEVDACDTITASVDMPFSKKAKQYAQAAWNKGMSVDRPYDFVFNAMTKDGYSTDHESVPANIQKAVDQVYEEEGDPNDPSTWVDACDVTATSDTRADLPTFREFATTEWEVLNDGSKRLKLKDLFVYFGTDKQWNASDPGYWYEIKVGDKTYKESKKYSINNKERCYKAMQQAISKLLQSDNVESCDKVIASTRPHPPIPAGWERVPEGDDEEGNWSTISKELPNNGGYIWLDLYYDDNDRRYYELQIGYRNSDGTIGDIRPLISKEFYRLSDAVQYAEDRINRESDSEDIESCDKVETSNTKYFANMVSASIDDGDYNDEFLVEGYYDNQRRGLAESAETSDVSALNELINEYANKGYYITVHNLTDGTITEFSADNWFDDLARDGGAILFMS